MSSLIPDGDKNYLESVISDVADTFARPIVIFKKNLEAVIFNNPNHNFIFDQNPGSTQTNVTIVSGVFQGRILYDNRDKLQQFSPASSSQGQSQVNLKLDRVDVRVKLDVSGAAFINEAQRITIDGTIFEIASPRRPHGLFSPIWYTYYLKQVD